MKVWRGDRAAARGDRADAFSLKGVSSARRHHHLKHEVNDDCQI